MLVSTAEAREQEERQYTALPTIGMFHEDPASMRSIVGPVGSGKTTGLAWEICYYIPWMLHTTYGVSRCKWVVVRNTYRELVDTTMQTVLDWFGDLGQFKAVDMTLKVHYPQGPQVEVLFRACDKPQDIKKFKSLEVFGYWIDESIEVPQAVKLMLRNRIGRYPSKSYWADKLGRRFPNAKAACHKDCGADTEARKEWWTKWMEQNGIKTRAGLETTNPPDVDHPMYSEWDWKTEVPGPMPSRPPKKGYSGFWQPPYENRLNLRPGYYDDLREDYRDTPDWIEMYVEGKPGIVVTGKLVYNNFRKAHHVSKAPLIYMKGATLVRGWDNSGNLPAAVVLQVPTAGQVQVLREYWDDRKGIVDFTRQVVTDCAIRFPGAEFIDWCDPAGFAQFSKREGGFTSNSEIMAEECNVHCQPSEQNLTARIQAVDQALGRIDGVLLDPSCTRLINGFLGGYHYAEIANSGRFQEVPEKNRFSHPHDALQYAMVKVFTSNAKRGKSFDRSKVPGGWRTA